MEETDRKKKDVCVCGNDYGRRIGNSDERDHRGSFSIRLELRHVRSGYNRNLGRLTVIGTLPQD